MQAFVQREFEKLSVGDTVISRLLVGWGFKLEVRQDVAEYWVTQHHLDSVIRADGLTAREVSIKTWEAGVGIVVDNPIALPKERRLALLQKIAYQPPKFALYISKRTQKES